MDLAHLALVLVAVAAALLFGVAALAVVMAIRAAGGDVRRAVELHAEAHERAVAKQTGSIEATLRRSIAPPPSARTPIAGLFPPRER